MGADVSWDELCEKMHVVLGHKNELLCSHHFTLHFFFPFSYLLFQDDCKALEQHMHVWMLEMLQYQQFSLGVYAGFPASSKLPAI